MSNSVQAHPWDSPGKNTGVGCRFLPQCMKVKSESEVAQSCPTLHDPMDCSLPGSSVHGIFQVRVLDWEWGTINHVTCKIIGKSNLHAVFNYLGALDSVYGHTFHYFFTLFLVTFICTVHKLPLQ